MINYDDFVCFIPLRLGSKTVPNKNTATVGGIPLFFHSISHALNAGFPRKRVVLSTNDPYVERKAIDFGLTLVNRPDELCTDLSSTEDAMIHALDFIPPSKHIILLQATSPYRDSLLIQKCINKYLSGNYDSLLTTLKIPKFLWEKNEFNEEYTCNYNVKERPMKQQLREKDFVYFDNGCLYISNIETLKQNKSRIGNKVCVFPISFLESFQIDTKEELQQAEWINITKNKG